MGMGQSKNNKKELHVAIIGNSVAMRVRPPGEHPNNRNYTMLLREDLSTIADNPTIAKVVNFSSGGTIIRQVHHQLDDIIRLFPDYYVINVGVVDASTREIPRWFFNMVNNTSQSWKYRITRLFYEGLIKKFRRSLVFIRGKRSWVGANEFQKLYALLLDKLLRETNAEIIGLSINLANDRVEKALPGSRSKHEQYNKIIKKCLDRNRCRFLDLTDLTPDPHYPDGVHYSAQGHGIVAQRIRQLIAN